MKKSLYDSQFRRRLLPQTHHIHISAPPLGLGFPFFSEQANLRPTMGRGGALAKSVVKKVLLSYAYVAIWIFLSFTVIVYKGTEEKHSETEEVKTKGKNKNRNGQRENTNEGKGKWEKNILKTPKGPFSRRRE